MIEAELHDGTILEFPDGTSPEIVQATARRETQRLKRTAALPQSMANIESDKAGYDPVAGMGTIDKLRAGAGRQFVGLGRGVAQLGANIADAVAPKEGQSRTAGAYQREADARQLDAPLMGTTAGKVGSFAGSVAAAIPAAFVPGVNSVAGAGVVGAGLGLLQPVASTTERVTNTALGGVAGAGGQKAGQLIGQKVGQKIATRAAAAADDQAANAVRDATLKEARRVGYVVPPSTSNPTVTNRVAESISGKAATQQSATVRNQKVTNRLVRQELGLSQGAPLTTKTLDAIRKQEGAVYAQIKKTGEVVTDKQFLDDLANLSRSADEIAADFPDLNFAGSAEVKALQDGLLKDRFSANGAIEAIKKLRAEASKNLAWNVEDPSKKALGLAQREAAGILEDQVSRHLGATGKGALVRQFEKSRQVIAKTYSVQSALNEGTGNVVATKLATQLRKGKPLSGNLEIAAKFASAFPKAAGEQTTSPGVSAVDALIGMAGGATVDPTLFGLPLARIAARGTVLSKPYQNALATPGYSPNNALLETLRRTSPLSAPVAIGLANAK
jgi:hypothetical protein